MGRRKGRVLEAQQSQVALRGIKGTQHVGGDGGVHPLLATKLTGLRRSEEMRSTRQKHVSRRV